MRPSQRGDSNLSYSEVLRVVGAYADRAHLSELRVLETDDGLILQGLVTEGDRAGQRDTYQLSTEDIEGLLRDAYAKRGTRI
jgi:hypothetical protein